MSQQPTTADLLKMLKGIMGRNPDIPAEGFHPTSWWAKEWQIDPSKARQYLAQGVEAGLVETQAYFICQSGVRRKVPHYKINPTQPK